MLLPLLLVVMGAVNADDEAVSRRIKIKQKNKEQTKESKERVAAWAQYFEEEAKSCDTGQSPAYPSNPDHQVLTVSEWCQALGPNAEGKTPMVLAFEKSKSGYLCDLPFMSDDYCDNCYIRGKSLSNIARMMHKLEKDGMGNMQLSLT